MTQYLQRLIARLPGDSNPRPLVPFIRTASGTGAGEVADPFETAEQPPSQPAAPLALEPGLPATDRGPERRDEPPAPLPAPPAPAGAMAPAARLHAPDLPPPAVQPAVPEGTAPPAAGVQRPARIPAADAGATPRPRRPTDERPAADSHTPAPTMRPVHPPQEGKPDVVTPVRPKTEATVRVVPQTGEPARETPERPAPAPPVVAPAAERERTAERPAPALRPPEPAAAPPVPRPPERPRVVIGRLSVEVVPEPTPTPQPTPTRPAQSAPKTPNRSEGVGSKLRFGLGQM